MSAQKNVLLVVAVAGLIFGWYYSFVDTLSFSELVRRGPEPGPRILVSLFDFDTGLTRYDILRLRSKAPSWERRMRQISEMEDPEEQHAANTELLAEMMEDPAIKKMTRKTLIFSGNTALGFLEAVKTFKVIGMF